MTLRAVDSLPPDTSHLIADLRTKIPEGEYQQFFDELLDVLDTQAQEYHHYLHQHSQGIWWDSLKSEGPPNRIWTPAVTQNISVSMTVERAAWARIGNTIYGSARLNSNGSGTALNRIYITAPLPPADSTTHVVGAGHVSFPTSGAGVQVSDLKIHPTLGFFFLTPDGSTALGNDDANHQITAASYIEFHFLYEVA